MSNFFRNNMKLLKKRYPHIHQMMTDNTFEFPFPYETFLTPYNQANIKVRVSEDKNICLYDSDDIIADKKTLILKKELTRHDILICIGMGLGYESLVAVQAYSEKPKIVIIERFPEMFKLALQVNDLRDLLSYDNLDIYIGANYSTHDIITNYRETLYSGACRRLTHTPSRLIFGDRFLILEKEIEEHIKNMILFWNTIRNYGVDLMTNSVSNLTSLFNSISLKQLKNRLNGAPVICVASGPSLNKDLPYLKRIQDNAIIFACDSAVKPLLSAGVKPHMVFIVDHMKFDFEKLRHCVHELRDTILVFFIEANPDSVRGFLGEKRVMVSARSSIISHWLGPALSLDCKLDGVVTSNTDAAILTAIAMGADPIILVGMDLAFSHGLDHAGGTIVRTELRHARHLDKMVLVDGIDGLPVYTLRAMATGKSLLENLISETKTRFVDASLSGAFIKGAQIKSLQELEENGLFSYKNALNRFDDLDWSFSIPKQKRQNVIDEMKVLVSSCKEDLKSGMSIMDEMRPLIHQEHSQNALCQMLKNALLLYKTITQKYQDLLFLLQCTRYEDQLETDRRILSLGDDKNVTIDSININTAKILKDFFKSVYESVDRFEKQISECREYFKRESELSDSLMLEPSNHEKRLELAHLHEKAGAVWLAEKEYHKLIVGRPDNIGVWLGLIRSYDQLNLRKLVWQLIEKAEHRFDRKTQIDAAKKGLYLQIDKLLEDAENSFQRWVHGEKSGKEAARRKVIEVLEIFPKDPRALDLQTRIIANDKSYEIDRKKEEKNAFSNEKALELQKNAKQCIAIGDYERAIGIYEGLIEKIPDEEVQYRLHIGDIRLLQNDAKSALWHYKIGFKMTCRQDFASRIQWVKPLVHDIQRRYGNVVGPDISIILPAISNPEEMKTLVCDLMEHTQMSHEILLISNSMEEKKYLDIAKQPHIKVVTVNDTVESPTAINTAIRVAQGKYILMLSPEYKLEKKWFETLLSHLSKNPSIGLLQPIIRKIDPEVQIKPNLNLDKTKQTSTILNRHSKMTSCEDLCLIFRVDLIHTVGLFDETFTNISEMLEDFRRRCAMEGFHNLIAGDTVAYCIKKKAETPSWVRIREKWESKNLPESIEKKYLQLTIVEKAEELERKGETDNAVICLVEGINQDPNNIALYHNIVKLLINDERFDDAMDILKTIPGENSIQEQLSNDHQIKEKIKNNETSCLLATVLFGQGKIKEAEKIAIQVLDKDSENILMLNLKGKILVEQNNPTDAESYFSKAMMVDPGDGTAFAGWGKYLINNNQVERGFDLLQRGFALSPEDPKIIRDYHLSVNDFGLYAEASEYFEAAMELYPTNKKIGYIYIDILLNKGDFSYAMEIIEKAIVTFGPEERMLKAALSIREMITNGGIMNLENLKEDEKAAVILENEIPKVEALLYEMKQVVKDITVFHNGNAPMSEKIARVFGAETIELNNPYMDKRKYIMSTMGTKKLWVMDQEEVLSWMSHKKDVKQIGEHLDA